MNPVVHFEMPAEDRERMATFYEKAFGWKMTKYGPEMGNYVVAETAEADEKTGRPKMPVRLMAVSMKRVRRILASSIRLW